MVLAFAGLGTAADGRRLSEELLEGGRLEAGCLEADASAPISWRHRRRSSMMGMSEAAQLAEGGKQGWAGWVELLRL